jgi:hypothetical protein
MAKKDIKDFTQNISVGDSDCIIGVDGNGKGFKIPAAALHEDSGWISFPPVDSSTPYCRKLNGVIFVRFAGVIPGYLTVGTLPAGFRPNVDTTFYMQAAGMKYFDGGVLTGYVIAGYVVITIFIARSGLITISQPFAHEYDRIESEILISFPIS